MDVHIVEKPLKAPKIDGYARNKCNHNINQKPNTMNIWSVVMKCCGNMDTKIILCHFINQNN